MTEEPAPILEHMFQAAVEFAITGIRTLVLVNGAAVISLLTFVGQVWANDQKTARPWPISCSGRCCCS